MYDCGASPLSSPWSETVHISSVQFIPGIQNLVFSSLPQVEKFSSVLSTGSFTSRKIEHIINQQKHYKNNNQQHKQQQFQ